MKQERPIMSKGEIMCIALSLQALHGRIGALTSQGLTREDAFMVIDGEMRFGLAREWPLMKIADALATGSRIKFRDN